MRHRFRILTLLVLGLCLSLKAEQGPEGHAAGFALRSLDGQYIFLSNYCETANQNGKAVREPSVVVLNFMASWCAPCIAEMPLLEALHQQYKTQGLKVFLISEDKLADQEKLVKKVKDLPQDLPVLLDPFQVAAKNYGVVENNLIAVPRTVVIAADGRVVVNHSGQLKEGDPLFAQVARLIAEAGK